MLSSSLDSSQVSPQCPSAAWYDSVPLLCALFRDCRAPYFVLWFVYLLIVLGLSFPLFFRESELFRQAALPSLVFYFLLILTVTVTVFTIEKELRFQPFSWFAFTLFILWLAFSLLWVAFFFDQEYLQEKYRKLPPTIGDRSIPIFLALVSAFLALCLTFYHAQWLLLVAVFWGVLQIFWSFTL